MESHTQTLFSGTHDLTSKQALSCFCRNSGISSELPQWKKWAEIFFLKEKVRKMIMIMPKREKENLYNV
jgi:hypothetical protein